MGKKSKMTREKRWICFALRMAPHERQELLALAIRLECSAGAAVRYAVHAALREMADT